MGMWEGKSGQDLADRAGISLADLKIVSKEKWFINLKYCKRKSDDRQDPDQIPIIDLPLIDLKYDFPNDDDSYLRYDGKTGEPLPEKEQPPTRRLYIRLRTEGQSVVLCRLIPHDKSVNIYDAKWRKNALDDISNANIATLLKALDDISMPWRPVNNWKSLVLQRKDSDGNIILSLQKSIPYDLMGAVLVALFEINRKERKILGLDQTPPAPQPPQPRPYYEISDNCPYKDENETYALIWQILINNPEGISREALKDKAIEITGKPAPEIDEAIDVVISRKDSLGKECDERALTGRGYWVEEDPYGQLIIRFPVFHPPGDKDQEDGNVKQYNR